MLQFSVVTTKTTDEYVEESDDENPFGSFQDIPTIKDEPRPSSVVSKSFLKIFLFHKNFPIWELIF